MEDSRYLHNIVDMISTILQGQEYDDDDGYEDDALEDEEGGAYY